jgi:hypothetical protein
MLINQIQEHFMQRNNNLHTKRILFAPQASFPCQEGPMCYFYALALAMQMQCQASLALSDLPTACVEILAAVNQVFEEATDELDDLVDEIFADQLSDDLIASLNLSVNGEPILTVENFMSEYPHSYAMGLLMGFKLDSSITLKELTLDTLADLLRRKGPMTFDGGYGEGDGEHTILVIGCEKEPSEMIFYLNPNDPTAICQMAYSQFIEKMTDCGLGVLHAPVHRVRPLIDTMTVVPGSFPRLFQSVLGKRKLSDAGFANENESEMKKQRIELVPSVAPVTTGFASY